MPVTAGTQTGKDKELAVKIKGKIAKLGTGSKARVEVKLKDGATLKGNVREVGGDYFVLVEQNGNQHQVTYAEVEKVKSNNGVDQGVLITLVVVPVVLILSLLAKGN